MGFGKKLSFAPFLLSVMFFACSTSITIGGGVVTTLAGKAGVQGAVDGKGPAASFYAPSGIAVDSSGNIYVGDSTNNLVRKITPDGVVTTLAGSGKEGHADGKGKQASFNGPGGVAVDSSGNVYVADTTNDLIRKITKDGLVTTLAGTLGWSTSKTTDGKGSEASFYSPLGIAISPSGDIYVSEGGDNLIRKVTPEGEVTTFAGPKNPDVEVQIEVPLQRPIGLAFDLSGNLYVADMMGQVIWKITKDGTAEVLAGSGSSGSADGTGKAASFRYPSAVAVDKAGNVFVADHMNMKVRKITPDGVVTTLAGTGKEGSADGIGTAASFSLLDGIAISSTGILYVVDQGNNLIRKIQ